MTSPSAPSCWARRARIVSGLSSSRWTGRAVDVADACLAGLGFARCRRARIAADPAAGQAPDKLVGRDLDEDRAVDERVALGEGASSAVGLRRLRGKPSRMTPLASHQSRNDMATYCKLFTRLNQRQLEPFLEYVAGHPARYRFATFRESLENVAPPAA